MEKRSVKAKLHDLSLYIIISIVFVIVISVYAVHTANTGSNEEPPTRWMGLGVETAILFGYFLRGSRHYWKRSVYWIGLACFFLVHLVGFIITLRYVEEWPLVYFVAAGTAEWVALVYFMDLLLSRQHRPMTRESPTSLFISSTFESPI